MINVEPVTGRAAEEILSLLKREHNPKEDVLHSFGITISGFFDVTCRNEDGSVDWEVHQPNLLTDCGRRMWMANGFSYCAIFTSGNTETPLVSRYSLNDSGGTTQTYAAASPGADWGAQTRTWSYTFPTPGANRPICTVGLLNNFVSLTVDCGAQHVPCYSVINPMKTQLTTQTLEISYRLTMRAGV